MDDGAPGHTSIKMQQWWEHHTNIHEVCPDLRNMKLTNGETLLKWPADSPYLNPIEDLWSSAREVKNKSCPRTADEIKRIVENYLLSAEAKDLARRLHASFKKRLEKGIP